MTSDIAIRAERLSKQYVLGSRGPGSDGLRHLIHDIATSPLRRLKATRHQIPHLPFPRLEDLSKCCFLALDC